MKMTLSVLLLLSSSAFAQRINECPRAGEVLSTQFLNLSGDRAYSALVRTGNAQAPSTHSFSGSLTATTHKNYLDRVCAAQAYIHREKICDNIHPDVAFGRGNGLLHSIFDLRVGPLHRAENFMRNVRYNQNMPRTERLEMARQIVSQLAKYAAELGLPRSWAEFTGMTDKAVADGFITLHLADEITKIHADHNRRHLGFEPLAGVTVTENRGNGQLARALDLRVSPNQRARLLQDLINGLSPRDAQECARTFVEFAAANGIPHSWQQFELMIRDAAAKGVLSAKDLRRITVDQEENNRKNLGFEVSIVKCRFEDQRRLVNVIEERYRKVFEARVSKSYSIGITNAPLVAGESETFAVSFDGLHPVVVSVPFDYNNYTVTKTETPESIQISAVGARKMITPANELNIKFKSKKKVNTLELQYPRFDAAVAQKVLVKVRYFDDGWLFGIGKDEEIGSETFELTNANVNAFTAQLRKDVDYVLVSMQIVGSKYHDSNFSAEKKIKD